jgi:hypothetical protein
MDVFGGVAEIFAEVFGKSGNYFAPGSSTAVPCHPVPREPSVTSGSEMRRPELSGKFDTLGKFVSVPQSEVAAPEQGGRFVLDSGQSFTIVGKPTMSVDGPAMWICKVG